MDILKRANKFSKLYKTSQTIYWQMLEWKKKGLSYRDIHARLERRHISISYWATWYWIVKGIEVA